MFIQEKERIPLSFRERYGDYQSYFFSYNNRKLKQEEIFYYIEYRCGTYYAVIIDRKEANMRKMQGQPYEWTRLYKDTDITGFLRG